MSKPSKHPPRSQKVILPVLLEPVTFQNPITKMALVATTWAFVEEPILKLVKLGISTTTMVEELKSACREKATMEPNFGKDLPASLVRYFLVRSIEKDAAVGLGVCIIIESYHLELGLNHMVLDNLVLTR